MHCNQISLPARSIYKGGDCAGLFQDKRSGLQTSFTKALPLQDLMEYACSTEKSVLTRGVKILLYF